jgi:hypothetical protein
MTPSPAGRSGPSCLEELDGLANRGYTEGFYRRHPPADMQNYADGASRNRRRIFVAEVLEADVATGLVTVAVKNRFARGEQLELLTPFRQSLFSTGTHARPGRPGGRCGAGRRLAGPTAVTLAGVEIRTSYRGGVSNTAPPTSPSA